MLPKTGFAKFCGRGFSRERPSRLKPLPQVYPVQRRSPDEIRGYHHLSRIASGLRGMHD